MARCEVIAYESSLYVELEVVVKNAWTCQSPEVSCGWM